MIIAGLDADRFNNKDWIRGGTGSPYEFKMSTGYAGALRVDNHSIKNLRLSLSGYMGNSARNTLNGTGKYDALKGTVLIGAFDFLYSGKHVVARGNFDYGYLSDAMAISNANKTNRKDSPSHKNNVGECAMAAGMEVGYDLFSSIAKMRNSGQRFFIFGRYDFYDSMYKVTGTMSDEPQWERRKITAGINYYPIKEVVLKAEYNTRIFKPQFNNEPTFSLGIAYYGLFKR